MLITLAVLLAFNGLFELGREILCFLKRKDSSTLLLKEEENITKLVR